MSERMPQPRPESVPKNVETGIEHHRPTHNKAEHKQTAHEKQENISSARNEVKKEAKSAGDVKLDHGSEQNHAVTAPISRELKSMMRSRTLTRIQKELPAPQRTLSKIIHTKPVEVVSAIGEKTIARPVGLLGGGLFAFAGSVITFYTAKHYGFRYNLLLFFLLFVGGYMAASIVEGLARLVKKIR